MGGVSDFKLWTQKESFFLVEILSDRVRVATLTLDSNKCLALRSSEEGDVRSYLPTFVRNRFPKNVIIAADSSLAFSAPLSVLLERENGESPLDSIELENLLAQAVGRVFTQCRSDASRTLNIEELDVILVYTRIGFFKVDGHRVVNPVGFRGEVVEAILELTYTTRTVFERLRPFLDASQSFFFTEIEKAELEMLRRVDDLPFQLLTLDARGASFFRFVPVATGNSLTHGVIDWSPLALPEHIARAWGVSAEAAREIYHAHLHNEASRPVLLCVSRIITPALQDLFLRMERAKLKGRIYLDTAYPVPFSLPYRYRNYLFLEPPLSLILDRLGFTLDAKTLPTPDSGLFRRLAPFFEYYGQKSDSKIDHWLRRRLHWLGSPGSTRG